MASAFERSFQSGKASASSASDVAKRIAAPRPCTARAVSSMAMLPAAPHQSDAPVKTTSPITKSRRRPNRSAIEPDVRTTAASATVYASTTHWRPEIPASRLDAIFGSAVLTTAMSSMSMAVARHTTARVPRRLNMATPFGVENEVIAVSLGAGRARHIGGTWRPEVRLTTLRRRRIGP